jgi:hypothetical protein
VSGIAFGPSLLSRADASPLDNPLIAVCAMGALARTPDAVSTAIRDLALPLRFDRVSIQDLGSEKPSLTSSIKVPRGLLQESAESTETELVFSPIEFLIRFSANCLAWKREAEPPMTP